MTRREALFAIAATLIPKVIRVDTPVPFYNPHPAQVKFFNQKDNMVVLYGIPYHQSNAGTGEWLGIHRGQKVIPDILKMIRVLESTKKGDPNKLS